MMTLHDTLLAEVRVFCRQANIAETTFGKKSVNDWQLIERIKSGRVTLRTVERIRQYIAENSAPTTRTRGKRRSVKCLA